MSSHTNITTVALFLFLPLNPSKVEAKPLPMATSLILWVVTFVFEVVLPEGVLAYLSQVASRGNRRVGNVVTTLRTSFGNLGHNYSTPVHTKNTRRRRRRPHSPGMTNKLVLGSITIACVIITHKVNAGRPNPVPCETHPPRFFHLRSTC